jgi:hypothetical protein
MMNAEISPFSSLELADRFSLFSFHARKNTTVYRDSRLTALEAIRQPIFLLWPPCASF